MDECCRLRVPGLAEKRPSVITGDAMYVSFLFELSSIIGMIVSIDMRGFQELKIMNMKVLCSKLNKILAL